MNGEIYRLNIRFDLADKTQRSIVEQLQSIDRKRYGSINKFIIAAIGKAFDSNGSSTLSRVLLKDSPQHYPGGIAECCRLYQRQPSQTLNRSSR